MTIPKAIFFLFGMRNRVQILNISLHLTDYFLNNCFRFHTVSTVSLQFIFGSGLGWGKVTVPDL